MVNKLSMTDSTVTITDMPSVYRAAWIEIEAKAKNDRTFASGVAGG